MICKLRTSNNYYDSYTIIFGNEKFNASKSKEYPTIGKWTLTRKTDSNILFDTYFPVGNKMKFKDIKEIKKWIRDRKYL